MADLAFRRLAYHRSWFMIGLGVIGLFGDIGNWILQLDGSFSGDLPADETFWFALGALASLVVLARGLTGAWGKRQLRVDIAAGKLMLPNGSVHDLDAIGRLDIERHLEPTPRGRYAPGTVDVYRLRAANLHGYLFESPFKGDVTIRLGALEAAVLQNRIRRSLDRLDVEGAFHPARALRDVCEIAGGSEPALAALRGLRSDPDPKIRERARRCIAEPST